ncbi:MAG: hypothetical protein H7199_01245 [Burkholderiales bacterium]|nr:hypothetical protein [Flavobacterium sp.]
MKITILQIEKADEKPDYNTLYNLLKRSEEDLMSRFPTLQEFVLEIILYPNFIKYNNNNKGSHTFKEDQSAVRLKIPSYPKQENDKIYRAVTDNLNQIKLMDRA